MSFYEEAREKSKSFPIDDVILKYSDIIIEMIKDKIILEMRLENNEAIISFTAKYNKYVEVESLKDLRNASIDNVGYFLKYNKKYRNFILINISKALGEEFTIQSRENVRRRGYYGEDFTMTYTITWE